MAADAIQGNNAEKAFVAGDVLDGRVIHEIAALFPPHLPICALQKVALRAIQSRHGQHKEQ